VAAGLVAGPGAARSRGWERTLSGQPGLRERQRARIREDIRDAAFALLSERGDDVSVGDIAERAGVSERTFYRYFPTREDALLDWIDAVAGIVHSRVRHHPAGEPLSTALQEAFVASIDAGPDAVRVTRTVFSSPRLFNAYSEHQRRWEADVAEVLAERLGTSVEDDPRPELWAAMAFTIGLRVSHRLTMGQSSGDLAVAMREAFRQAAELFDPSLDVGGSVTRTR